MQTADFKNTALVVFSFSAKKEAGRKQFASFRKDHKDTKIFQNLIQHTKKVAYASGLDVIWLDEEAQSGETFGERFGNSLSSVYELGYQYTISIANDCPDISTEIIHKALEQLAVHNIILGPAKDGGEYLIGLHQSNFDAGNYKNLAWETDLLHTNILELASLHDLTVNCLKPLMDIDQERDLRKYITDRPLSAFSAFIIGLQHIKHESTFKAKIKFKSKHVRSDNPLRAPPTFSKVIIFS